MTQLNDEEVMAIALDVVAELRRATEKFGPFASTHEGYAVIKEELDELWDAVRKNDLQAAIDEAKQLAAMGIRFVYDVQAILLMRADEANTS